MPTFAVLGGGGWGTAISVVTSRKPDTRVRQWCAHPETCRAMCAARENKRQLPGIEIPPEVEITDDPAQAVEGADCWLVAVPTAFLRTTIRGFRFHSPLNIPIVSLTKGIEIDTFQRPSEVLRELLGDRPCAVLSGPSHAEEVARGMPTSVVVASADSGLGAWVQAHLGGDRFRIYTNSDVIGVELAGALKNVIGIAAGCCDGLRLGDNAKAALLTRGLVEMTRFGVAQGAEPATFGGLAGIGDLITTCFSGHGRNRRVGERLARGETFADIVAGPQVAEGIYTAKSVHDRTRRMGLELPIMSAVYHVIYEGLSAMEAVQLIMSRRQREEN